MAAGYLLAALAVAAWGGNFVIGRALVGDISPVGLAAGRWLVAAVAMAALGGGALWRARADLWRRRGYVLWMAFCGVTIFNTTIYFAAQTSPAVDLLLVAAASPVFTLLFAPFSRERVVARQWLGGAIAAGGILWLARAGGEAAGGDWRGYAWMIFGAAVWAAYTASLRRRPRELGMTAFHTACVFLGLPPLLLFWGMELAAGTHPVPSAGLFGGLLYVGLVASVFCYYCWNGAVTRIGAARTSAIYYFLPFAGALEAAIFLGESVTARHFVSMGLVLCGVALIGRR